MLTFFALGVLYQGHIAGLEVCQLPHSQTEAVVVSTCTRNHHLHDWEMTDSMPELGSCPGALEQSSSHMQGASLRTPIQLGGPVSGTKQVPDDVASILQPTSTRYKGPLDLDAAVAERVNAMNASWMASEGDCHSSGTTYGCTHVLTMLLTS